MSNTDNGVYRYEMHIQHTLFVHLHTHKNAKYILQLNNIIIANDWANALPCFSLYGHAHCQTQFEKST